MGSEVEAARYWFLQGAALAELGRSTDAEAAVHKGLALEPGDVSLLGLLAHIQTKQRNFVGAERTLLDALRLSPSDPYLLVRYSWVAAKTRRLDKAHELLKEASTVAPELPAVHRMRGILAYLEGDDSAAARSAKQALALAPDEPMDLALLSDFEIGRGRLGEATDLRLRAARSDPDDKMVTELAWEARFLRHPLMRPLWFVEKVGPVWIWLAAIGGAFALNAMGLETPALIVAGVYVFFALYSWIVPRLLRRRFEGHL